MGACASCLGLRSLSKSSPNRFHPTSDDETAPLLRGRQTRPRHDAHPPLNQCHSNISPPHRNALKPAARNSKAFTLIHDLPPILNDEQEAGEQRLLDAVVKRTRESLRDVRKADSAYGNGSEGIADVTVTSQQEITPQSTESTVPYEVQRYKKRPAIQADTFAPPETSLAIVEPVQVSGIVGRAVLFWGRGESERERIKA